MKEALTNEFDDALDGACKGQKEDLPSTTILGDNVDHNITKDDESHGEDDNDVKSNDESETFSDIDDHEVDGYLHNEEEKQYKKIIWEKMNWEYLQEQAAKEAAAAAGFPTAAIAKPKKDMKQRRGQREKNSGPAQSATEAACQMARKKRLSSKVNYDRLAKLFDEEPVDAGKPKKVRFDIPSDDQDNKSQSKDDELGSAYDFEDGEMTGEYEYIDDSYFPEDDGYAYNYDDDQY